MHLQPCCVPRQFLRWVNKCVTVTVRIHHRFRTFTLARGRASAVCQLRTTIVSHRHPTCLRGASMSVLVQQSKHCAALQAG